MKQVHKVVTGIILAGLFSTTTQAGSVFDSVKEKGYIQCGVSSGLAGFSIPDLKGNWSGIDVDVCRAVAAAVFGDSKKVKYTPTTAKERFTALQSGEIDILSRNSTWTITRDTSLGLNFAGVNYYDGQSFMVKKSLGVSSALELDGVSVCVHAGTTTELNLADYFRTNNMEYDVVSFDHADETAKAFDAGRCDTLTTDQSGLYAVRNLLTFPSSAIILPEVISKEPLGPLVAQGDDEWFNIVRWSLFAMINAEELGITSSNIYNMSNSSDPAIRRFLGLEGIKGRGLGLSYTWSSDIIKQVGNYGESFERNLGMNTALKIKRGHNALWTNGGILYAPPIR